MTRLPPWRLVALCEDVSGCEAIFRSYEKSHTSTESSLLWELLNNALGVKCIAHESWNKSTCTWESAKILGWAVWSRARYTPAYTVESITALNQSWKWPTREVCVTWNANIISNLLNPYPNPFLIIICTFSAFGFFESSQKVIMSHGIITYPTVTIIFFLLGLGCMLLFLLPSQCSVTEKVKQ